MLHFSREGHSTFFFFRSVIDSVNTKSGQSLASSLLLTNFKIRMLFLS